MDFGVVVHFFDCGNGFFHQIVSQNKRRVGPIVHTFTSYFIVLVAEFLEFWSLSQNGLIVCDPHLPNFLVQFIDISLLWGQIFIFHRLLFSFFGVRKIFSGFIWVDSKHVQQVWLLLQNLFYFLNFFRTVFFFFVVDLFYDFKRSKNILVCF